MQITNIEPILADRYLFVVVETDDGITGYGECGSWAHLAPTAEAVRQMARYLVGRDPLCIEDHWQAIYRAYHFRGAVIMGALSGIDIALWDIAGKHFDAPIHRLLGGPCRKRLRAYFHVRGETAEELVVRCREAKELGFTAVGHLNPYLDESRDTTYFEPHARKLGAAVRRVVAFREAVGDEVDLCIELHRRLTPAEAIPLSRELAPLRPMFLEDPIKPDSLSAMIDVAHRSPVPIATGERLHTIHEFAELLSSGGVKYVRPDLCLAGGITHVKKIAAVAEAFDVAVVPHNPLGPISTAACVQLGAAIPNFALQEYNQLEHESAAGALVTSPVELDTGFLVVPTGPGLGIDLDAARARRTPEVAQSFQPRRAPDGSVVDY